MKNSLEDLKWYIVLYVEIGICDGKFARIGTILVVAAGLFDQSATMSGDDSRRELSGHNNGRRPGGLKSKGSGISLPVKIRGICRFLASSNPVKPL